MCCQPWLCCFFLVWKLRSQFSLYTSEHRWSGGPVFMLLTFIDTMQFNILVIPFQTHWTSNLASAQRHRSYNKLTAIQLWKGIGCSANSLRGPMDWRRRRKRMCCLKSLAWQQIFPQLKWEISVSPLMHFEKNKASFGLFAPPSDADRFDNGFHFPPSLSNFLQTFGYIRLDLRIATCKSQHLCGETLKTMEC